MADPNPPSPQVPRAIQLITGPVLVGALLSYMLLGILIVQLYIYYMSFPKDKLYIKLTVYLVCAIDLASTISITEACWLMLIEGWGRPENLHIVNWGFSTIPVWNSTSSAIVQYFFAWRVWILGNQHSSERMIWRAVTVLIVIVSFVQMVGGTISTAIFAPLNDILKIAVCFPSTATWLAGSAVSDVLITISMIILLSRGISRGQQASAHAKRTDALLTRLIRNTIETAAITATAAILELVFFLRLPFSGMHVGIAIVLSKLYTNTLLASLNARLPLLRDGPTSTQVGSTTAGIGSSTFGSSTIGGTSTRKKYITSRSEDRGQTVVYLSHNTEVAHPNDKIGDPDLTQDDLGEDIPMRPLRRSETPQNVKIQGV